MHDIENTRNQNNFTNPPTTNLCYETVIHCDSEKKYQHPHENFDAFYDDEMVHSSMTDSSMWDEEYPFDCPTDEMSIMTGSGESMYLSEDWGFQKSKGTTKTRRRPRYRGKKSRTSKVRSWEDTDLSSSSENLSISTILDLTESQSFACQVDPSDIDLANRLFLQKPDNGQALCKDISQPLLLSTPTANCINSFLIKLCIFGLLCKLLLVLIELLLIPVIDFFK